MYAHVSVWSREAAQRMCAQVSGTVYVLQYCNTLQRDGSKQCFIIKQVRLAFEGLTNVSRCSGPLWVCVQNITEAVVMGGKWQQRRLLKFGKNEGWGLGCSNIAVLGKPWYDCTWEQAVLYSGIFPESRSRTVTLKRLRKISINHQMYNMSSGHKVCKDDTSLLENHLQNIPIA